jgi:hypothetical protein
MNEHETARMVSAEHDITRLQSDVARLDHKLFGNGQPGVLDKMERRLSEIESTMAFRFERMETKLGRMITIVAVLGATAGGGAASIANSILTGGGM